MAKAKRNIEIAVEPQPVCLLLGSFDDFKSNIATIKSRLTYPLEVFACHGVNRSRRDVTRISLGLSTDPVPTKCLGRLFKHRETPLPSH